MNKATKDMLDFFWLFRSREFRRIAQAWEEGYKDGIASGLLKSEARGEIKTMRNVIICALRNRFPNEPEKFFSSCAQKLEKKNMNELNAAFDVSTLCSNANELVESL